MAAKRNFDVLMAEIRGKIEQEENLKRPKVEKLKPKCGQNTLVGKANKSTCEGFNEQLFLNELIETLNPRQRAIYDEIINSKEQVKIFITGEAGTGKSHLIRAFGLHQGLAIVSPTGVAASVMNGTTIHSYFKINPHDESYKAPDKYMVAKLNQIHTIIIDEISMVRYSLVAVIEEICRTASKNNLFFGGKNIILFGDFFQLAPIFNKVKGMTSDERLVFEYPEFWNNFSTRVLIDNMRQTDLEFIKNLNRIRNGKELDEAIKYFNLFYDPEITNMPISERKEMLYIAPRRATAAQINDETLLWLIQNTIDRSKMHIAVRETVEKVEVPNDQKAIIKDSEIDTILPEETIFFEGMRFMVTKNLDPKVYNGLLVTIEKLTVTRPTDESAESKLFLTVAYNHFGKKRTYTFNGPCTFYSYVYPPTFRREGKKHIGFPLQPAYGATTSKIQGSTVEGKGAIVETRRSFGAGMAYVALSRVRDSSSLKLATPLQREDIIVDQRVLDFYDAIMKD